MRLSTSIAAPAAATVMAYTHVARGLVTGYGHWPDGGRYDREVAMELHDELADDVLRGEVFLSLSEWLGPVLHLGYVDGSDRS
jgi:hypothetical protein